VSLPERLAAKPLLCCQSQNCATFPKLQRLQLAPWKLNSFLAEFMMNKNADSLALDAEFDVDESVRNRGTSRFHSGQEVFLKLGYGLSPGSPKG